MSVLTGVRSTLNIEQFRRKVELDDKIYRLYANEAPLTVLLKKIAKSSVRNPKFSVMEDDYIPEWTAINHSGGYSSGDTQLVVDDISYFRVDDLVKVPRTGEVMLVTAVTTGTSTITVTRSVGATAAASINDNEEILIITDAVAEDATLRTIKSTVITEGYNYTQIFRHAVGASGTEMASDLYGAQDRPYLRKKVGEEHLIDIEKAFWFGERSEGSDSVSGMPQRTTGGVLEFVSTYKTNIGGALTESDFEDFLRDAFTYGSEKKILFASPLLISVLNKFSHNKQVTAPADTEYGVKVSQWISAHGELYVVKHRLFTGATYGKMGMVVDLDCFDYKYLNGRDTSLLVDRQENDRDGWRDEYLTECGLGRKQEKKCAMIYGITG